MQRCQTTRQHHNAFTLIELLIVIAIIALLAAIVFPVFATARDKGRQAACLSNTRQLGNGLMLYVQDSDEMFPFSYAPDLGNYWPDLVRPYTGQKAGGNAATIFLCPSDSGEALTYSTNPQVIGLYEPSGTPANFFASVVALPEIAEPTSVVLLGDALTARGGVGLFGGGNTAPVEYAYPHPALTKDHTRDDTWCADWVVPATDGCNNKQIAWRHSGGANFVYSDGHAKWSKPGRLKDGNFDVRCKPGVGCTGKPTPPDPAEYPAVSPTCGGESALNCE